MPQGKTSGCQTQAIPLKSAGRHTTELNLLEITQNTAQKRQHINKSFHPMDTDRHPELQHKVVTLPGNQWKPSENQGFYTQRSTVFRGGCLWVDGIKQLQTLHINHYWWSFMPKQKTLISHLCCLLRGCRYLYLKREHSILIGCADHKQLSKCEMNDRVLWLPSCFPDVNWQAWLFLWFLVFSHLLISVLEDLLGYLPTVTFTERGNKRVRLLDLSLYC